MEGRKIIIFLDVPVINFTYHSIKYILNQKEKENQL